MLAALWSLASTCGKREQEAVSLQSCATTSVQRECGRGAGEVATSSLDEGKR